MEKNIYRSNNSTKKIISLVCIILAAVILGLAVNFLWIFIERQLYPKDYEEIIARYSDEYGVPEYIIYATIKVESDFDPNALSSAGAVGLMQMMPSTFEWLTGESHLNENLRAKDLRNPEVSIRYGTYYLAYLHRKFDYNWDTVFAAYNAGEGKVREWLSDSEYSDTKGNLTNIPYKETRDYVKKINDAIEIYKNSPEENT